MIFEGGLGRVSKRHVRGKWKKALKFYGIYIEIKQLGHNVITSQHPISEASVRKFNVSFTGPYLGFFVCGGKLGFREISDQYSYKKQPSKIRHYVRKKTFSFPGGGNCPLRPPAMYGPGLRKHFSNTLRLI